tara:strand:- start:18450 stop:18842 length:393 start_codon:yes stop_codon:yes gene_type:complete
LIDVSTVALCFAIFCIALSLFFYNQKKKLTEENKVLKNQKSELFSKKRSTEVRTGHIVEKFAPFLDNFPHDPESAVFLGQPIDYLVFEEDSITFSEIKSGKSQLSQKQRNIRDNILNGNVFWEEIRIDEK